MGTRAALIVAVITVPLLGQTTYYLPQVVDGAVSSGTIRTTILLANIGTTPATVSITFTHDDGSPRQITFPDLGGGSQFSLTLPSGSTRILQTDGSGDGSAGAAAISSTAPLGVSTVLSAYDPTGALLSESGSGSSTANGVYVIPVDTTGGLNTGVAIYNPGPKASALTFALLDVNGAQAGSATASLSAGGHLSRLTAGDLFPGASNFQGTLTLTASTPVAAVAFRQNSTAPSYTLLEATQQSSQGLKFYLPQAADGPFNATTLRTTFLLYNLSANPAQVSLTLSQASGAPWIVNIPGQGANSTFPITLPPAGAAFLQTDGQGASTNGVAIIQSSQPIGVAAVETATDGNGNFLGETAMLQSPAQGRVLVPFDTTNNINTGLAMYNPGSQPVNITVSQLDSSGNTVASAAPLALPPGAGTTAFMSDLFPGVANVQGALWVSANDPAGGAVAVVTLRQNSTPLTIASSPAAPLPLTGAGVTITSSLDTKNQVQAAITPSGGSLALTDARGNKFSLTIPANALLSTTTITMTPVTSIAGLPAGGTFNAGVQLEPDGLELLQPALLTIALASSPSVDSIIPLGWHGGGQGIYLNLVQPQSNSLTMVLNHFSGAGVASGNDAYLTAQLLNVANVLELDQSWIAYWLNKGRLADLLGHDGDGGSDLEMARQIFANGYVDIQHFMELALETKDDDTLQCAIQWASAYENTRQVTFSGVSTFDGGIGSTIYNFILQAGTIVKNDYSQLCLSTHDPIIGFNLVGFFRANIIDAAGGNAGSFSDLQSILKSCSPTPSLNFQSEIAGTNHFSTSGGSEMAALDAKVTAQVTLAGTVTQDSFNGSGNGYTSYLLNGSAPDNYTFTFNGTAVTPAGSCTASQGPFSGSTLVVTSPQSRIDYQFTPTLSADAKLYNGQTLAQFCPVYKTKPVAVTLAVNPGSPQDSVVTDCPGASIGPLPTNYWQGFWNTTHGAASAENGVITGWQIPGSSSFAHKEYKQNLSLSIDGVQVTELENSTLDLNLAQ